MSLTVTRTFWSCVSKDFVDLVLEASNSEVMGGAQNVGSAQDTGRLVWVGSCPNTRVRPVSQDQERNHTRSTTHS